MPLRTRNNFPPGGFRYVQKETKFSPTSMMPFSTTVQDVLNHRKANNLPRATREEVEFDVDEYNCARLGNDPQYCVSDKKKLFPESRTSESPIHRRSLARHVEAASAISSGIQILRDWVGDGMIPISADEAQQRADVCTGRLSKVPCPLNQKGSIFIASIASAIQSQMEKRNEMVEKVKGEEDLKSCEVCFCHLPLKVHVPMDVILDRTPDAMKEKFLSLSPSQCWMRKAIEQEKQNNKPAK